MSYYNSAYNTTYNDDGTTGYYNSAYNTTYYSDGGSAYYNSAYNTTYNSDGSSSYYNSAYNTSYNSDGGSTYYNDAYNTGYYSGDGGGCYLTTACMVARNRPDDCYELELLRTFRDDLKTKSNEFIKLVNDYYYYAPMIVEKINACEDRVDIYEDIYCNLVVPTVKYIEKKENDKAIKHYLEFYNKLKDKYIEE